MAATLRIQAVGTQIPVYILSMAPYLVTILMLIIITAFENVKKKIGAPESLGLPFLRK